MAYEASRTAYGRFTRRCENLALRVAKLNLEIDDWEEKNHDAKDKALKDMENFKLPLESAKAYRQSFAHWKRAVESRGDCEIFEIEAQTRVLLGTGNASVFEFGFNLSYPWGVPYIAGTSLKGLLSSYLARHGGNAWWKNSEKLSVKSDAQVELFGGTREETVNNPKSYVGSLVFHDAKLAAWTARGKGDWFDMDIITSHHALYYGEKRLPDATENPIPIKIAALCPGLRFLVVIQGPEAHRKFARKILLEALLEEGIGSKTSVGYGRFAYALSDAEKSAQVRACVEQAASPSDLAELYKEHKNNASLRGDFKEALGRMGYAPELKSMFEALDPLGLLYREVENSSIKDLKMLNQRFKSFRQIGAWKEQEGVSELKNTETGRKLFNLIVSRWKQDLKANPELNVLKSLAYTWEDLDLTAEDLLKAVEDPGWVWPPIQDLPAFLENNREKYDNESMELIAMALKERAD